MHRRFLIAVPVFLFALGPAAAEASLWGETLAWISAQQRAFHLDLSAALKALKSDGVTTAAWGLVLASFLYGVFHAAGPGHGKVVLTTYLLTHGTRVRRGIAMAAAAAFLQGLVAVVLVYGLIYLVGWLPRDTSGAVSWSERLSYALVAGIGLVLAVRAVRSAYTLVAGRRDGAVDSACVHDHDHGPTPQQLDRAKDLRTSAAVVVSIGLRPCSGSILVLVFAKALGMAWAGVGAVAAISAGTAIAVACLALLATSARNWAASAVSHSGGTGWQIGAQGVALVGGGILIAIGGSLLADSFATSHPLGL